jgi:hypothetical protein
MPARNCKPLMGEAIQRKDGSAGTSRHWIASLTLAMTTPRTTRQPSSLHSLTHKQTHYPVLTLYFIPYPLYFIFQPTRHCIASLPRGSQ